MLFKDKFLKLIVELDNAQYLKGINEKLREENLALKTDFKNLTIQVEILSLKNLDQDKILSSFNKSTQSPHPSQAKGNWRHPIVETKLGTLIHPTLSKENTQET